MAGVNKVIILGNVGKDPEVKTLDSGKKVARFSIATSESWKDSSGEKKEQTEWHSIVFFGPACDVVDKYVKKGAQLYVEGKLSTRSYDDKEGVKRFITEVVGSNLSLLGGKPKQDESSSDRQHSQYDNDLPF